MGGVGIRLATGGDPPVPDNHLSPLTSPSHAYAVIHSSHHIPINTPPISPQSAHPGGIYILIYTPCERSDCDLNYLYGRHH